MLLGVNIDHVATLRNARGVAYPSPLQAALIAESAGADLITLHLREDRRHIHDDDVAAIAAALSTRMNLEMAMTDEMLAHALKIHPADVCLVPERRQEVTTEGGLDIVAQQEKTRHFVKELSDAGIRVSLFIDADEAQIDTALNVAAPVIELHTGAYANAQGATCQQEYQRIENAAYYASEHGLIVNAGHGLTIHNVANIAKILAIQELNIGHALIAQAVFIGLPAAIQQMKTIIHRARSNPY